MKKIIFFVFLTLFTTVNATKTYLFNSKIEIDNKILTNNDNYNYGNYILNQNQILIVTPENGLISNDKINVMDYKIKLFENSDNSKIEDIEYNDTTGSFTYFPSNDVVGEVSYKYYIEYDGYKSNVSYIYFYVKNNITSYNINFYDKTTKEKIISSINKVANANLIITEKPIKIENYKIVNNKSITKKINILPEKNNFDFYYEKIPNTGI